MTTMVKRILAVLCSLVQEKEKDGLFIIEVKEPSAFLKDGKILQKD